MHDDHANISTTLDQNGLFLFFFLFDVVQGIAWGEVMCILCCPVVTFWKMFDLFRLDARLMFEIQQILVFMVCDSVKLWQIWNKWKTMGGSTSWECQTAGYFNDS